MKGDLNHPTDTLNKYDERKKRIKCTKFLFKLNWIKKKEGILCIFVDIWIRENYIKSAEFFV